jgi:hypothetical protein
LQKGKLSPVLNPKANTKLALRTGGRDSRRFRRAWPDRRARLQGLTNDILIIGAIAIGAIVVLAPAAGLSKVWDEAVRFNLRAASVSQGMAAANWQMVLRTWPSVNFQWIIFALSALCLFGGWQGLVVLIWWICILIGLLYRGRYLCIICWH